MSRRALPLLLPPLSAVQFQKPKKKKERRLKKSSAGGEDASSALTEQDLAVLEAAAVARGKHRPKRVWGGRCG